MVSRNEHVELVQALFKAIELKNNGLEAPWYEPWNVILQWLVERTSPNVTVAPQYNFIREFTLEGDESKHFSIIANISDDFDFSQSFDSVTIKKDGRVPDFTLFENRFAWTLPRTQLGDMVRQIDPNVVQAARSATKIPCLIVEIKPVDFTLGYARKPTENHIKQIAVQALGQARWVMEEYKETQYLWVLCAIGLEWSMIKVTRDQVIKVDPTLLGATSGEDPTYQPVVSDEWLDLTAAFELELRTKQSLFKPNGNDYNPTFMKAWDTVIDDCQLSKTRWDLSLV